MIGILKSAFQSALMRFSLYYGVSIGLLVILLRVANYQFLVHSISMEAYIGMVAILFAIAGIWIGNKINSPTKTFTPVEELRSAVVGELPLNDSPIIPTSLSKRELEILNLMAMGLSNQEIADRIFISLSTVKTHASNVYIKLDTKRRTQAIQRAKELGIIA